MTESQRLDGYDSKTNSLFKWEMQGVLGCVVHCMQLIFSDRKLGLLQTETEVIGMSASLPECGCKTDSCRKSWKYLHSVQCALLNWVLLCLWPDGFSFGLCAPHCLSCRQVPRTLTVSDILHRLPQTARGTFVELVWHKLRVNS